MRLAQETQADLAAADPQHQSIAAVGQLLGQLIEQDVEFAEGQIRLREGTSRDRIVSVHDPETRHGRKSSAKLFDAHKAATAVDEDSQLFTAVDVLAGNAADPSPALPLTEASEQNTGLEVEETVGDCAFGDGNARQEFAEAQRKLIAKVSNTGRRNQIHKSHFHIDLEAITCTCPAGDTTANLISSGYWLDQD